MVMLNVLQKWIVKFPNIKDMCWGIFWSFSHSFHIFKVTGGFDISCGLLGVGFYCFSSNFVAFISKQLQPLHYVQHSWLVNFWENYGTWMPNPANCYLFIVNSRNTRKRCEICSNIFIDFVLTFLLWNWTYFTPIFLLPLLTFTSKCFMAIVSNKDKIHSLYTCHYVSPQKLNLQCKFKFHNT